MTREKVPEHTMAALERYIEQGYRPGSFLEAVLCNDLKGAVMLADHINRAALPDIVEYIYNCIPMIAWGSGKNYEKWLEMKREEPNKTEQQ